jgi:hypothetical protein
MRLWLALIFILTSATQAADLTNIELLAKVFPVTHTKLFRNLKDQKMDNSYEFDVNRTPERALEEGTGGQCNMHARVAALSIMRSGISASNLRIVSAVNNSSLAKLCSGRKGKAANIVNDGLSGHVFLLLKSGKAWYLVNTTTVPGTPPAKPFGQFGLEYIPFMSAHELEEKMRAGPVALPDEVKATLPPTIFGNMTIFHSVRPDQYPLHILKKRPNLISSGSLSSDICRYDGAQ